MSTKKRVRTIVYHLLNTLSYIVPKKKGLILFWPLHNRNKVSGNLKALYLALKKYDYKIYWVVDNLNALKSLQSNNVPAIRGTLDNINWYWTYLRAQKVIIDGAYHDLYGNIDLVQLWHGAGGPKNVGLLNNFTHRKTFDDFKRHTASYSFVLASSEYEVIRHSKSFGNPNVYITGSPKNDSLFNMDEDQNLQLKLKLGLQMFAKVILYVPTFRDSGNLEPFSAVFWAKLNAQMQLRNHVFVIKKHPWDKALIVPLGYSHIMDISTSVADVQDILIIADILVSDYSSIVSDFVLLHKPLVFYIYDYEHYVSECRNLYFDMMETLPGPFAYDEEELLKFINDLNWFDDPLYQKKYVKFLDQFNYFKDGKSSERVLERIGLIDKK